MQACVTAQYQDRTGRLFESSVPFITGEGQPHLGLAAAHELAELALEVLIDLGGRRPQHPRRRRLVIILPGAVAA